MKLIRASFIAKICFIFALFNSGPSLSFGQTISTPIEPIAQYDAFRAHIRSLGLPNVEGLADYLALEIFYNVPGRGRLARSIDQVKIIKYRIEFNSADKIKLSQMFPDIPELRITGTETYEMNSIRISGHISLFVWDPYNPKFHFIWKPGDRDSISTHFTDILQETANKMPETQVDFAIERNLSDGTLRLLRTHNARPSDRIYPLHGFLGSPLLEQTAAQAGLSTFEWLNQKLMPLYAEFLFDTSLRYGMQAQSHTQNLWIVFRKDGTFHLAHKDYANNSMMFFLREREPLLERKNGERSKSELLVPSSNELGAHEFPRGTEPAISFASYSVQAITQVRRMTISEAGTLLHTFLNRFIERIDEHFGVKIEFSRDLKMDYDRLPDLTNGVDLRGFKVWTAIGIFTWDGGFFGLAAHAYQEIEEQLYSHILGPRTYPKKANAQNLLSQIFLSKPYYHQLAVHGLHALADRHQSLADKWQNFKNTLLKPFYNLIRASYFVTTDLTSHFEYTDEYVLWTNSSGKKIYGAVPFKNAARVLADGVFTPETAPKTDCNYLLYDDTQ